MNILMVLLAFTGPYGAERLVIKLSNHLTELGCKTDILTLDFDRRCASLVKSDVSLIELKMPKLRNVGLGDPRSKVWSSPSVTSNKVNESTRPRLIVGCFSPLVASLELSVIGVSSAIRLYR